MIDFGEHVSERKTLDLTPMIDVVFLLLIFFMLTSIFAKPAIPLDLPQAETAESVREPEVAVAVKLDGTILLNGDLVAQERLYPALAALYEGRRNREISLLADKGVPFGRVVEIMDVARKAGAENLTVVAERPGAR